MQACHLNLNKMRIKGQVKRNVLSIFTKILLRNIKYAKHKIDESIPSAPEVLFGLKKTQELVAAKEFVVSDVPSIGQNAFEKIPPDSAK